MMMMMMMIPDYIPPEVLFEIFLRLPVKSLLRFCCVCKLWYSLISDPNFISAYTHFTTTTKNDDNGMMIVRRFSNILKREIFTLNYDDGKSLVYRQQLNCPLKSSVGCFEIVGSCYGLVCLTDHHLKQIIPPKPIIVWNPLVGKSVTIPVRNVGLSHKCDIILGFGFDFKNVDYKVVRIVFCPGDDGFKVLLREVEVYNLSVDSWRSIKSKVAPLNCVITQCSPQAFVNGAIHWIGYRNRNEEAGGRREFIVVVFDVADETFRELEMPEEVAIEGFPPDRNKLTVSEIGGSLALFRYYRETHFQRRRGSYLCYIWVMKEYGVRESWTKQYKICLLGGFSRSLGLRSNGEILLVMSYGQLVSYDPESERISPLEIYGESSSFFLDSYKESLLLWKGMNGVSGQSSSHRIAR